MKLLNKINIDNKSIKEIIIYGFLFQATIIISGVVLGSLIGVIFPLDEVFEIEREPFAYCIWAIFLAPILEELIFRKFLYNKLENKISRKKAMILSSVIFGIIHIRFLPIILASIAGYQCCLIYDKYKTIVAAIIFHGTCNAIGLLNGNVLKVFYVANITLNSLICFIISFILLITIIILLKKQYKNLFKNECIYTNLNY